MTTIEQYLDEHNAAFWGGAELEVADALRAVAKRHTPNRAFNACSHCSNIEFDDYVTWPCPTIADVHVHLGIDGKDQT